jgi:hypothetical protein
MRRASPGVGHMARRLLSVMPVLIVVQTLFGCVAMHRSNTAEYDEHMKVSLVAVVPREIQPKGLVPAVAIAIAIGKEAASAVLNWEAGKYTQEAVKTVDHIAIPPGNLTDSGGLWELTQPLYLLIVRTVSPKPITGFWNNLVYGLTWFDHPSRLEEINKSLVTEIGTTLAASDSKLTPEVIYQMLGASPDDHPKDHSLGFVALLKLVASSGNATTIDGSGKLTPTEHSDGTVKLQLLAYRYSALKAKNLGWIRIPFVDWHKTSSVLTISIKGPLADKHFSNQRQVATTSFEVTWDREGASCGLPSSTQTWNGAMSCGMLRTAPLKDKESAAIRLAPWNDISIEASIAESNSLKEVWENLSKRTKEIDIKAKD